jgi:DNA (cytosine-5)-methyltransferase 1
MNELALFAGAGGGILGGKLLGWRTVCAVEWEKYPASVLLARQNDGILPPFPIWDDVQTFDGRPWQGIVDVISGGFPCQDISVAGKGDGLDGERSGLWREMARIIGEVRPKYAFVENSPMLTTRGLGTVLRDLAKLGFDAEWGVLGADDVGANHHRKRIWILAYSHSNSNFWSQSKGHATSNSMERKLRKKNSNTGELSRTSNVVGGNALCGHEKSNLLAYTNRTQFQRNERTNGIHKEHTVFDSNNTYEDVGNTEISRLSSCFKGQGQGQPWRASIGSAQWWKIEPPLDRVANGVDARVDRLKAIGNGQVPLCAATAWNILKGRLNA